MKTSYKIALAICCLILVGGGAYAVLHNKKAPVAVVLAPPETNVDPVSPILPTGPAAPDTLGGLPATDAPLATTSVSQAIAPPAPTIKADPATQPPAIGTTTPTATTPTATTPPATTTVKTATATPEPGPTTKPAAQTHTVHAGDTLSSISQKYYGDQKHTDEIYNANRKVLSAPNKLKIGDKLTIPAK